MATATEAVVQTKFQMIELGKISESPMNPRKHFDPQSLKELAESIKAHGVQQPIVVRPDGNKQDRFEIVVGARRFKASKLASRTHIPAIINPLSNAAALEIMVIENLQREDVHPLDEALGYEALMKKASETDPELGELPGAPRHTAESIAAKVGKSVGYVYARLKLLALVPAAREAFEQDRITPGHAVLIARLTAMDQLKALNACFHSYADERKFKGLDPQKAKFADIEPDDYAALLPEKSLREWIQENVNLRLKDVPWSLTDELLVPAAGACATCLKRSTSNPALFAELAIKGEDTCFDAACYKSKREAFVKNQVYTDKAMQRMAAKHGDEPKVPLVQLSERTAYTKPKPDQAVYGAGQWVPAKKESCATVREGILVKGDNAGARKFVCIDPDCKVHKKNLQSLTQRSADTTPTKDEKAEAAGRLKERIDELVIERVLGAAVAKIKKPDVKVLRAMVDHRMDEWYGDTTMAASVLGLKFSNDDEAYKALEAFKKKADLAGITRLLFLTVLADDLVSWSSELKDIAKLAGTDIEKVRKALEAEAKRVCYFCGCTELTPCKQTTVRNTTNKVVNHQVPPYLTVEGPCGWVPKGAPATDCRADVCTNPACIEAAMKDKNEPAKPAAKKAKAGK
jgi:ParB family chromosome partitioning protein